MRVTRRKFCTFAAGAMALAGPSLADGQESGSRLLRYTFTPPLGKDVVQSIETIGYLEVGKTKRLTRWSHEVVLHMKEQKAPDEYVGTFRLRNVANIEEGGNELDYLIAKAIEGETYPLTMLNLGIPLETDWSAIQQRIKAEVPKLTDSGMASTIAAVLPRYANGVDAVLRPTKITGLAHVISFRRDGESHLRDDLGTLSYLGIKKATTQSSGGKDAKRDNNLAVFWRVTPDRQAATLMLGSELVSLANTFDAKMGTNSRTTIAAAIAGGLEASEYGNALYDPKLGLMREVVYDLSIIAGSVKRVLRYKMVRLSP